MKTSGIYIYGLVPNFYPTEQFHHLEKMGLSAISFQNILAITGQSVVRTLENLSRESLAQILVHHQQTIEKLMESGFKMIIPMRLATIVETKQEVKNMLQSGYELIMDTFGKIDNMIEMDVVATYDDLTDVIEEVSLLPEIKNYKESLLNKEGGPGQADLMKIGFLIKQHVDAKKEELQRKIFESLNGLFVNAKKHEVMNDQMITNTAFLLKSSDKDNFERVIDNLDENWNGFVNFKLVGPLPCYSFSTLELNDVDIFKVESARDLLGLPEAATELQIKKAYYDKAKSTHPDAGTGTGSHENFDALHHAYKELLSYISVMKNRFHDEMIPLVRSSENENLIILNIRD